MEDKMRHGPLDDMGPVDVLSVGELGTHLAGKSALVIGGTRGIGMGTAICLASCGVNVTILGRNTVSGSQVVEKMKEAAAEYQHNVNCKFIDGDFSTVKGAYEATQKVIKEGVAYDILAVTIFMFPDWQNLYTVEGLEKVVATGVLGRYVIFKHCHEFLQPNARILNVAYLGTEPKLDKLDRDYISGAKKPESLPHSAMNCTLICDLMALEFANRWKDNNFTVIGTAPGWISTDLHSGQGFLLDKIVFPLLDSLVAEPLANISLQYTNILASPKINKKLTYIDTRYLPRLAPPALMVLYNKGEDIAWACNFLEEHIQKYLKL